MATLIRRSRWLAGGAEYEEVVGQIDPTIGKPMPPRKIHHQYVVSKEDGK